MEKAELEIAQYALKLGILSQSQFKSVMKWANLCLNFSLDIPLANIIFEGYHWNWEQKQQYMNLFVDTSEVVHLRSILDPYRMELDENWYNPISSDAFQKNYDQAKSIQSKLLNHSISWKIEHIVRLLEKPSNAISPILMKPSARKIQLQTVCNRMFDNKLMLPEFSAPKLCQYLISDIETVQSIGKEIEDCNIPLIQLLIEKCDIDANLLHLLILSQMYIHDTEIEFQWNYQTWTKLSIPSFLVPALKTIKRNCINFLDKTYSFAWYTFTQEEEKILLEYYKKHINPDFWEHYTQVLHVCQQNEFELSPLKILLMMGVLPTSLAFAGVLGYIYKIPSQQILSILQSYNLLPNQSHSQKSKEEKEEEKRLYTRRMNAPLQRTLAMHRMNRALISNDQNIISNQPIKEKIAEQDTIATKKIVPSEEKNEVEEKSDVKTELAEQSEEKTAEQSEEKTELDEKKQRHALISEGMKTGRFDKTLLRNMMQNYKASEEENESEEKTKSIETTESQNEENEIEESESESLIIESTETEEKESSTIESQQKNESLTEQSESKEIEPQQSEETTEQNKEKTEEEKQRSLLIADGLKTGRFDKSLLRSMLQKFKSSKSTQKDDEPEESEEKLQQNEKTTEQNKEKTEEEKQRSMLIADGLKTGRFDKNLLRSMMQKFTSSKSTEEEKQTEENESQEAEKEEKQNESQETEEEKKKRHALISEGMKTGRFDKNALRSMMQDYKASQNTSDEESEKSEEKQEFIAPVLDFELPDIEPETTTTPKVLSVGLTTGRFDRNQLKNLLHEFSQNQEMKIDIETLYFASTNRFEQEEQTELKEPAHIARMKRLLQRSNDKEKLDLNKTMELRIDTQKIKEEDKKETVEKTVPKKSGYSITINGDVALLQDLYLEHKVKQYDLVTAFFLQQDDEEKQSILEILSQRDFITPEVYQEYKNKKYEPRTLELEKQVNAGELELAQLLLSYNLITREQLKKLFSIQNTLYSIGIKMPFADIIIQNKIMSADMIEALIVEYKRRKEEAEEKQRKAQLVATEEKPLVVEPNKVKSLLDTIGLQIPLKNKKKKISWKNLTKGTQVACIVGLVCILFASCRIIPLFFNQAEHKAIQDNTENTETSQQSVQNTPKPQPPQHIPEIVSNKTDDFLPEPHIKQDTKNITVATENKVNKILVTLKKPYVKFNSNSVLIHAKLSSNQTEPSKKYSYTLSLWDRKKKINISQQKFTSGLEIRYTLKCEKLIPYYYNLHLELLASEQENSQVFPLDYNWWIPCHYGTDTEIVQYAKATKDMVQNLIKKFEKWNNMLTDDTLKKSIPKFTAKWKNIDNEVSIFKMKLKEFLLVHIHKTILTTVDQTYSQYLAHFKAWDEYNEGLSLLPPEPLSPTILQPLQDICDKIQVEKPQEKKKATKVNKEASSTPKETKDTKTTSKDTKNKESKNSQTMQNKKK